MYIPIKKTIALLVFSLFFIHGIFAQVTVDISSNVIEGCAPLEVAFTSQVQNCTGTVNYTWDFDFPGGNSPLANPTTMFQNPGVYTIILQVSCAAGSASDMVQITVHESPVAIISTTPQTGCRPMLVDFTDGSTPGDSDIIQWEWYFNDGTPFSSLQNPQHLYEFTGIFNVLLTVRDENNCSSTTTAQNLVSVSDTPSIAFVAFPLSYCHPPLLVNFQSNVVTNFNLPYTAIWDFGDGGTGSGQTTTHTYTTSNVFDVKLTAIDSYGCSNNRTYYDYINITELVPEFNMLVGSMPIYDGSVICEGTTVHFSNLTPYPCQWDFGGGQTSQLNIVNYSFQESGTYNITFTVMPPGGECENSVSFQLFVEEVSASFTTSPTSLFSCNTPFTVQFNSTTSGNVTTFAYTFGDGSESSLASPSHTYETAGHFPVVLTATTSHGCTATATAEVIIESPDATFVVDSTEGCAPVQVICTYTGTSGETITNYHWDFGDGSVIDNGNPEEQHSFANAGEYDIVLTVTDESDCSASSTVTVNVGNPIPGELTFMIYDDLVSDWIIADELFYCAQDTFRIYNSVWDNDDIDEFQWELDSIDDDNDEEYLEWAFDQDTGYVSVVFITNYNGCRDTLELDSIYFINGPVIESIQKEYDCEDPYNYLFTVNIINEDDDATLNWDWFIMQGETASVQLYEELGSTDDQLSYTFPGSGVYWVKVLARSAETECDFVDSLRVDVSLPVASFIVSDDEFCAGTEIYFDASGSSPDVQYFWIFGDGATQDWSENPITNHTYEGYGDFTVQLIVRDVNGCEVEATRIIHSRGPEITIHVSPDPAHGCNSLTVHFSYDVVADYPVSFNVWQISGSSQSYYQDEFDKTFGPGTYDVSLSVTTTDECSDQVTIPALVVVSSIEAEISTLDPVECVNVPVQFYAGIENPLLNYTWNFGDGGTSNQINPQHIYTTAGFYTATLVVDDGLGCNDEDEFIIEVQGIDVDFTLEETVFTCYPAFLDITNNTDSTVYDPYWLWTFETGDSLPVYEPQDYFINAPGTYWVKLSAYTSHGCASSDSVLVTVNGPVFHYYYTPQTICLNDTVHFEVTDMEGDYEIKWYITGTPFTTPAVDYIFTSMPPEGYTEVQLIVTSENCEVTTSLPVNIQQVISEFAVHDTLDNIIAASCSPFELELVNFTQGADTIIWTVGGMEYAGTDTLPVTLTNPYHNDSVFQIICFGQNELGCLDSVVHTVTVFGQPDLLISNDTLICFGDQISLYVGGVNDVTWSPDQDINDVHSLTPIVEPHENITYHVTAVDENSCEASGSVSIVVQQEPELLLTPAYDTIVIGDTVSVLTEVDQENITYTWTPQIDISCFDCPSPYLYPKEDTRYLLVVEDSAGCFRHNYYVDIYVVVAYSLEVPSAFTPLGPEVNSVVYAKGFGIKHFIEFRIFNRWGEEVFSTDDITKGWDGYYKGELQNIDTYKYFVRAEMWNGEVYERKGDILLMR
ncbi:MAG TPA: PKD domain-containing protein [Bacteroidales bacterium]|nr:PKD domain-containing protein [Bacteroidales bacterium]